jgi:hypothetical protein
MTTDSEEEGIEMNLRKLMVVGCALMLALALAGPASAAAAEWKHEGAALEEHVEIGFIGSEIFITEAGGMLCEVDATLTTEGGKSGQISNYETTKCMGLFGELAGCTVVATEQPGGPWPVDVNETDLTATEVTLLRTFDEGCPVRTIESTIPALTMTSPEPEAISELEYFGGGGASIDGGPVGEYEVIGSWFVTGEASGTYGIG